jgi:hypothetical protein
VRWFDPSTFRAWMADRVGKVPGWKPVVTMQVVDRFESCAIRAGMMKLPGWQPPVRSGMGPATGSGSGPPSSAKEGEAVRAAAGLNPAGRSRAGDQGLRLPRNGHDPAGRRGLPDKQV